MNMNMAGMNQAQGGPVGGGMMMMMNNGAGDTPTNSASSMDVMKRKLNTYIYDYFLNFGYHDHARAILRDDKFEIDMKSDVKSSPRGKHGEMNGIDDSGMDADSKDDHNLLIPDDLPRPNLPNSGSGPGTAFLYDWFALFFDIYQAQHFKTRGPKNMTAHQYLEQTQNMQRLRERQQNSQLALNPNMMAGQNQFNMRNMRNGMMPGDMRAAAMQNQMKSLTPQQISMQQQKMLQQQQMQREHSDSMDMNGHRQQSPGDPENVGSPSKRPRLGEQQFNGQMAPNGRGQGMAGVGPPGGQMLMQGLNPIQMGQGQFSGFPGPNPAVQQKLMQNAMQPNGMMNANVMPNQGSPMMQAMGADGQFMGAMPMNDLYGAQMRNGGMQGGPGATGGNHALQDYQMQLMLLEQQNKKRLMMARQEQDNIQRDGPMTGGPGMPPPGMSPSGSRTGTSPNPSDQMKRGTPQLGGLPGSPAPGDGMQGRGSPAAMNFMSGMPQDFNNPMMMKTGNDGMTGPGGPGMRPAGMNQNINMEAMRQQQGRMPGGNWQGGPQGQPMMPNPSQGQQQPMGTPGQRSDMPPPQAPATGSATANRTQPSSPQPGQAPPTPSQSNKPNPKRKGKEDTRKASSWESVAYGSSANNCFQKPTKKNSTVNAPASDAERATTPTPSTPITPVHPNSFNTAGKGSMANAAAVVANGAAPTSNPQIQQQHNIPPPDPTGFTDSSFPDPQAFNLDFSSLESNDVLNDFDFDSFLNNGEDGAGGWSLDPSLGGDANFGIDPTGVE